MKNKSAFDKILANVSKMKEQSGGFKSEVEYWSCERDKAGNGQATIRFLPAKSDNDSPFVKIYTHGFKGPQGKWYIENCPTTIGDECPACVANSVLWNSGIEKDKDIVRQRKRRISYIANVLVISDPKNPENEGQVKLFKFGAKIFDKIVDAMQPQFEDEEPRNPFDMDEGVDFKLKIRQVEGFANFDKSEFSQKATAVEDQETVMEQVQRLEDFIAKDKFKSYDDLEKKLNGVISENQRPAAKKEEDDDYAAAKEAAKRASAQKAKSEEKSSSDDDSDPDLDYFRNLAKLAEED